MPKNTSVIPQMNRKMAKYVKFGTKAETVIAVAPIKLVNKTPFRRPSLYLLQNQMNFT